jgi:hypothetical protein
MRDCREELLNRLTLAGWLLLIVDAGAVALVAPILLARLFPGAFALIASSGRLMALICTAFVGVMFFLCKVLLERLGIVVVRGKKVVEACTEPGNEAGHEVECSPPV